MGSPGKILIRADASAVIGAGHVMRMIALGQAWIDRGGEVILASCQCPTHLVERVAAEGFRFEQLETSRGSDQDAEAAGDLAQRLDCQWIILDGYCFEYAYQRRISSARTRLLVVDDDGYSEKWSANAILNQNLSAERRSYVTDRKDTHLLLGLRYALLRREITRSVSGRQNLRATDQFRLLVTLGGGETTEACNDLLHLLEPIHFTRLAIRLVLGAGHVTCRLEETIRNSPHDCETVCDVRDMSQQYRWADAVVSGAGSTCWEWLHLGLPGAIVRMADNQIPIAEALVSRGLAVDLGWQHELDAENKQTLKLARFLERVQSGLVASDASELVDGKGATRVCDILAG